MRNIKAMRKRNLINTIWYLFVTFERIIRTDKEEKSGFSRMFVYIVEDNRRDAHYISYLLQRNGVEKVGFSFGFDQGLKDLAKLESRPDLILVDWGLQNEGGVLFIHRAKKIKTLEGVPMELMTGMREKEIPMLGIIHKDNIKLFIEALTDSFFESGVVIGNDWDHVN